MDLNHGGAVVREEYQEIRSVFSTGRDHSGVSAVLFDPLEELVWTGNQSVGTTYVNLHVCVLLFYWPLFFKACITLSA